MPSVTIFDTTLTSSALTPDHEGKQPAERSQRNLAEPAELAVFLKERGHKLATDQIQLLSKKLERDQRCGMKLSTEKVLRLVDQLSTSERDVI